MSEKMREHPARKALIMKAFCYATELHIEYVDVDQVSVIALAEETGLTTCDASYLWLARESHGDLVSLDRRLQRAVRK